MESLGGLICRSSPSKGIENDITGSCRDQDGSFRDHRLQFVHARTDLEFRMTIGRCIGPEIRQIYALRIHFFSVTAVVPDLFPAMPAFFDGQPDLVEYTRCASCVIEKCVMGGIQLLSTWVSALHGQRDPVSEVQSFSHDRGKPYRKFGCRVEEECASRLQHSTAFENPDPAPSQVFVSVHRVNIAILVVLAEIEWWVGKDGIDHLRLHVPENMHAICIVEGSVRRGQIWLLHPMGSCDITRSDAGNAS